MYSQRIKTESLQHLKKSTNNLCNRAGMISRLLGHARVIIDDNNLQIVDCQFYTATSQIEYTKLEKLPSSQTLSKVESQYTVSQVRAQQKQSTCQTMYTRWMFQKIIPLKKHVTNLPSRPFSLKVNIISYTWTHNVAP